MGVEESIKELYERREKARQMGGIEQVAKQHSLGRLTVRERIGKLLDPGSFWEVGLLNRSDNPETYDKSAADGRVAGIGKINGREVAIIAEDRTVLGGSGGVVGARKSLAIHELGTNKGYPIVHLGDEVGGVRLPDAMGSVGMSSRAFLRPQYMLHPRQTPRVATIMGECFGSPSWHAAMSDFVVMVKGTSMGAAGPRIIEEAIGEKITPQELCGWELQARVTGKVDAVAENDEECLDMVKEFLSYMPSHNGEEPPFLPTQDDPQRRLDNVGKIVPDKLNRGYDMNQLIKLIVDDGRYLQIKSEFAKALITCLARLDGRVVGIIANNPMFNAGAPDVPACEKATSFICLCDSFNIPLIFLTDIPGMYPGKDSERQKLPNKIINWLEAETLATVPKISVTLRKAYGIGWNCMLQPCETGDFVVAWPTASISFVDPEIGVKLVYGSKISKAHNPEGERQKLLEEWAVDSTPWKAAEQHYFDDIIDPKDTRKFLIEALKIVRGKRGNTISHHRLQNWPTGF
jgi:acetyl-CoA carboxylase carboxyltransferase component